MWHPSCPRPPPKSPAPSLQGSGWSRRQCIGAAFEFTVAKGRCYRFFFFFCHRHPRLSSRQKKWGGWKKLGWHIPPEAWDSKNYLFQNALHSLTHPVRDEAGRRKKRGQKDELPPNHSGAGTNTQPCSFSLPYIIGLLLFSIGPVAELSHAFSLSNTDVDINFTCMRILSETAQGMFNPHTFFPQTFKSYKHMLAMAYYWSFWSELRPRRCEVLWPCTR